MSSTLLKDGMRWSILGTGAVARKFAISLRQTRYPMKAVAVASRREENARSFANLLDIDAVLSFDEAAVADACNAVYIATPPALHEKQALVAIAAGKAVLIEKPFAM